ncbi:glucose 1-dehydrogenase [Fulvivirgaceae bacterium BMA12]|uniref:Glucose 1-dehydrogenase n=1 Tax=Agaribacillus aureus TaxID=3051825 RepID=A0ABT8L726_9BACT|nr:glucose 1-dehydrogenase [Fulvivirgaceae bacterium BMA12]
MPDNTFNLDGKVAIITGSSKGIGLSIATLLGKHGAKVVISSRKQAAIEQIAHQLSGEGINAIAIAANAGSRQELEDLVRKTISHYDGIDIIVNNAATNPVFGAIEQVDDQAYGKIMDVNLKGPFDLCKSALPSMKSRGGGSIINISSVEGLNPGHGLGMYSVSKAGLIMLTKVIANEWAQYDIRCNAICPGLIKTKFSEALTSNEKVMKMALARIPMKRAGEAGEMAGLALFLASDASSYCTGGVYTADGGYTI